MKKQYAYKGFNVNDQKQLVCRNYIFEVGKTYELKGKLKMCVHGFHFCWDLNNIHHFNADGGGGIDDRP